jgi:hypothetical protein
VAQHVPALTHGVEAVDDVHGTASSRFGWAELYAIRAEKVRSPEAVTAL